jgi:hypothetical protein
LQLAREDASAATSPPVAPPVPASSLDTSLNVRTLNDQTEEVASFDVFVSNLAFTVTKGDRK